MSLGDRFGEPFPFGQPYIGIVTDNRDPNGDGRIRFTIPGEVEPESGWVKGLGFPGGGKQNQGLVSPPRIGAEVLVFFPGCDLDNPRYLPGAWPDGKTPDGHAVDSTGAVNKVLRDDKTKIEIDERATTAGLRVTDAATGAAVKVEIDLVTLQVEIYTTTGIKLTTVGAVEIDGATVRIAGRIVSPAGPPI